jgi:hypothetical protein
MVRYKFPIVIYIYIYNNCYMLYIIEPDSRWEFFWIQAWATIFTSHISKLTTCTRLSIWTHKHIYTYTYIHIHIHIHTHTHIHTYTHIYIHISLIIYWDTNVWIYASFWLIFKNTRKQVKLRGNKFSWMAYSYFEQSQTNKTQLTVSKSE